MKPAAVPVLLIALSLAACSAKPAMEEAAYGDQKVNTLTAEMAPAESAPDGAPGGNAAEAALRVPQLAYDYTYTFVAPVAGVEALMTADQAACERAGVLECQMISQSASTYGDARSVRKTLELRATPAWIKKWRGGLDASVAKAHARITQQNVSSEDLSLQIVDTSARIRNKEALRDRLQEIVRTSKGKVSELIEAETQLSQVQADIDASKSALAVMQKRVATSHLTLSYESEGTAASRGTFAPVADASRNILGNMMVVVALLINILSFLVPLAVIGVPAVWFGRKWWLARKAKVVKQEAPANGANKK